MDRMAASLEAQRSSVARQTGGASGKSFFVLPFSTSPPAPTPPRPECAPISAEDLTALAQASAMKEGVPPEILKTVARVESGLRPCAVSPKGAMGLMQLMPATARELGVQDPFDATQSMDAGARLLGKYLHDFGSLPLALGAYNAGPARVNEDGGVPRIPETLDYVRRILSTLGIPLRQD